MRALILAALLAALPMTANALPAHDDTALDDPMPAAATARPRVVNGRPVIWAPHAGPQTKFLASTANEVLYGGAAGGGKSAALVAAPLRWVGNGNFNGLLLRRETTQLDSLLRHARALYGRAAPGVRYRDDKHLYRFASGAHVRFNHCATEADAFDYQGDEFQFVAFDELTHFTEAQYREIRSRVRSSHPDLPRYTRATTNPGGVGHEWVFKRWGPWLDPTFDPAACGLSARFDTDGKQLPPARPGQVLWVLYRPDGDREEYVPKGTPGAQSRQFIPARLEDNPTLLAEDPGYAQQLLDNDPVRRAQLRDGNWLIKPAKGLYFKRGWFKFLEVAPADVVARVRYWDLAGSPDGDWAAGVRLAKTSAGLYVVEHVMRLRGTPGEVRAAVKATAELDGRDVPVEIEQDPGQAGKDQIASYVTELLDGWTVHGRPKRVNKVTAAGPISAQAQAGNVALVRGHWNEPFIDELEAFPEGDNDDQVDGLSGGHATLTGAGSFFLV